MRRKVDDKISKAAVHKNIIGLAGLYGNSEQAAHAVEKFDGVGQAKPRAKPVQYEHHEAVTLMNMLNAHATKDPRVGSIYHVPNGGLRHRNVALQMKSEGVRPSIPDYCIPVPIPIYGEFGTWHGGYLELKANGNTPNKDQKSELLSLRYDGYAAAWAEGAEDAFDFIVKYLTGYISAKNLPEGEVTRWRREP